MRIIYKLLLILVVVTFATSCDLTRMPPYAMDKETALESLTDASNWSNGQMSSLRGRLMGIFAIAQDVQADMLNASVDFGNRLGSFHNWEALQATDYDLRDMYHAYYLSIKNLNYFLSKIDEIKVEKDDEKEALNYYKGQALFLRAYYYSNLALRYGTKYNATSAGTDLCVALVLTEDSSAKPARATNKAIYEQIDKDLKEAFDLLSSKPGEPGSTLVTQDAIVALQARNAYYKNEHELAYTLAKKLIDSKRYQLGSTEKDIEAMWREDNSKEDIFRVFISRPDELPNTTNYYSPRTGVKDKDGKALKVYGPDWLPSQWVIDLYDEKDFRKKIYFEEVDVQYAGTIYNSIYVISKLKGNPAFAETTNDPAHGVVYNSVMSPKVFRVAEMYLIAAEAGAALGKSDAATYLNALRKSRGLDEVTKTGEELMKEIRDERTRELAYEGFRFFDLRKWNASLERRNPQVDSEGKHPFLNNNPSPDNFSMPNSSEKWIWGIPAYELNTNPNLVQNAGW